MTTPNVEIPIQWRDVPPHENPFENPYWQSGQCDLCAISGLPYDDCDQLHEEDCEWKCGLCGGNWATCRCPDDPAVSRMVADTARPSVSWAANAIATYLDDCEIYIVDDKIATLTWIANVLSVGGGELTPTDIAAGIDLLLSRLIAAAQAEEHGAMLATATGSGKSHPAMLLAKGQVQP